MADDINKKITISVEAQTDQLQKDITTLNQTLDGLLLKQKQLSESGQQNSKAFGEMAAQVQIMQSAIENHSQALGNNLKGVNALSSGFENLNKISSKFGPGLKEAAQGFSAMRSGLSMLNDQALKQVKTNQDQVVAIKEAALRQVEDFAKKSAVKIADDGLKIFTAGIEQQSNLKLATLEKDKTAELNNSSLTSAQKFAIQQKYKKQEAQIKAKAFKEEQETSIVQAVINGAIAITKAEAQTGVLGALVIPGIIAETAVQVAKIAAQKPPAYAKGGLHYQSDGRGGLLPGYSKSDNTNAFLRSGEGIVVSEAMQVPWARNLVSAINVGFGGKDFSVMNPGRGYAVGGIFTDGGDANRYYNQPVTDQKNLANTIAYQMINNFPPVYVDVKDVNNQQNILAQTVNRVNL